VIDAQVIVVFNNTLLIFSPLRKMMRKTRCHSHWCSWHLNGLDAACLGAAAQSINNNGRCPSFLALFFILILKQPLFRSISLPLISQGF